jgi:hypothetical protein
MTIEQQPDPFAQLIQMLAPSADDEDLRKLQNLATVVMPDDLMLDVVDKNLPDESRETIQQVLLVIRALQSSPAKLPPPAEVVTVAQVAQLSPTPSTVPSPTVLQPAADEWKYILARRFGRIINVAVDVLFTATEEKVRQGGQAAVHSAMDQAGNQVGLAIGQVASNAGALKDSLLQQPPAGGDKSDQPPRPQA